MRRRKMHALIAQSVALAATVGAACTARGQIVFGQVDDFQAGSTLGWSEGFSSPNPPTNIPSGGPDGAADAFLRNVSSGTGSAGSRQVMFNTDQWVGDYTTADVTMITGMMANFGATTLNMRYGVQGGAGTQYVSSTAAVIPPDGQWHAVTFVLSSGSMSNVNFGSDTLASVLGSVTAVRVLSSAAGGTWLGEPIASTLGIDDLRALTLPGDANHDKSVDTIDFNLLAASFSESGKIWADGDFNFDTIVDTVDFNLLASNFSQSVVPAGLLSAPVPEPAMFGAVSLALVVRLRRRRSNLIAPVVAATSAAVPDEPRDPCKASHASADHDS